jgi:NAD(P)-dependent dehydrogenase (short-subunit alcohol dehydrogenase family)
MDLLDKVVLLTGARRVGADVATAVAAPGADVAVAYKL